MNNQLIYVHIPTGGDRVKNTHWVSILYMGPPTLDVTTELTIENLNQSQIAVI